MNPPNHRPATRLRPLAAALAFALAPLPAAFAQAPSSADLRQAFENAPTRHAARLVLREARLQGRAPVTPQPLPAPRGGVTLPVTSCLDDADPGTLRNVLATAGEGDTIDLTQLTCGTITLTQGAIDTSVLGDNHLYDVTINGPGRDLLTIEAAGASQVFVVGGFSSNQGRAIFNDLTIAHGSYSGGLAGCITGFGGAVELNRVTVTDCHSSGTVPLVFAGAVDVTTLDMTDSVISDSTATATGINGTAIGAGFYASDAATLVDSTVSGNTATAPWGVNDGYLTAGGGLYTGDLVLTRSTISGNAIEATNDGENARGGGVFVRGVATLDSSTIDGNTADGAGGGVFKEIFSNYGDPPPPQDTKLIVTNTTISGNSASSGGGIATSRPLHLSNSTIAFNHATDAAGGVMFLLSGVYDAEGTLTAQSSIIASNTSDAGGATDLGADDVLAASGANNLVMNADAAITLPGDTLTADPLLLPLASNGGPTRTHALDDGSPAVDTGNNVAELEFDQRSEHFARVSGSAADIGAFERQQPPASDVIFRDGFDGAGMEYAYDDGDGDTNMGPPSSFDPDMLWGNYFMAQPGGEIITRISIAFGPTFPSLADGPVTFWLLQDADADFDPGNAWAIASVQATPDVFNDNYYSVDLPPTWVHDGFFVAASAKLQGGEDAPARVDTGDAGDKSWFYYAPDIAATIDDLASAPFGSRMDDTQFVVFPGAFMIRASGEPAP